MKIVIIGGGTAGWWTAGYLEKQLPDAEITLIESDTIPKIGVGESTLPQIKSFFETMGIVESDWMDKCNAIHKLGNVKQGWTDINDEAFPFTFWYNDNNVFDDWLLEYRKGNKTKTQINDDLYKKDGWRTYAYHLDAELAGSVVKNSCKSVKHIIATLDESNIPEADLYVDCTGFSKRFVKDKTEVLLEHHFVDSAVVCPYELDKEISPYTYSIARPYGWQFIISLQNRIGTGYCYSSKYISDKEAIAQFKEFNKHRTSFMGKEPRVIKWKPHILKNPWSGNTVAIGMSSGFIDPLESNALFMTQFQITTLARCIKEGRRPEVFNRMINRIWRENSIYILHHYMLSNRNDTEFWKYYKEFDVKKSLWKNYKNKGNKYTEIYPDAIWASLGLYFEEFDYYSPK